MSGYFGALLRASGLDAGAALAPVRLEAQAALPPSGPEMAAPADEGSPPQAGTRVPLAHAGPAREQPGSVTIVDLAEAHAAQAGEVSKDWRPAAPFQAPAHQTALAGPPAIDPVPQAALPATAVEGSATTHVEEPAEAVVHGKAPPTPLQAVLQWVAADPAAAPVAPAPAARGKATVASPHRVQPLVERTASPAPGPVTLEPARPPMIHAIHPAATEPFSVPPARRDDIVDISIGTIQVRVDAPPAQTVALPQAPAAPVATPPRSGLARRSLRRL